MQRDWDRQAWGKDIKEMDIEYIEDKTGLVGEWREMTVSCPHCTSDQFVYIYAEDDKTCYCLQCDEEFDVSDVLAIVDLKDHQADSTEDREIQQRLSEMVSDDPEVVKEMADRIIDGKDFKDLQKTLPLKELPAYQHKSWGETSGLSQSGYVTGSSFTNTCTHFPQHIIDGEGWGVWAGKKEDCRYRARNFDVVLNLTFTSIKEPHVIPIPELSEFAEVDCQYKEIQLDWPDYGVISMPREFWVRLLEYLEKNRLKMVVFCLGGHGRTGTAIAIMMGLALGYTAEQAINWVRRHYCFSAIETPGQEAYIKRMLESPEVIPASKGEKGGKK